MMCPDVTSNPQVCMALNASQHHLVTRLTSRSGLHCPTFTITKPTLEEWLNADPNDIIEIGPKHWNPTQHHDDMLQNAPEIMNAFNIEATECQPHCEPVLDAMANTFNDADSDMQAWHDHSGVFHADGTFCTDAWDINPFGTINTNGTFSTDAWDKDPNWLTEDFQPNCHSALMPMMRMTFHHSNHATPVQLSMARTQHPRMRWMNFWKT